MYRIPALGRFIIASLIRLLQGNYVHNNSWLLRVTGDTAQLLVVTSGRSER